jgi:hypothetical protein
MVSLKKMIRGLDFKHRNTPKTRKKRDLSQKQALTTERVVTVNSGKDYNFYMLDSRENVL